MFYVTHIGASLGLAPLKRRNRSVTFCKCL